MASHICETRPSGMCGASEPSAPCCHPSPSITWTAPKTGERSAQAYVLPVFPAATLAFLCLRAPEWPATIQRKNSLAHAAPEPPTLSRAHNRSACLAPSLTFPQTSTLAHEPLLLPAPALSIVHCGLPALLLRRGVRGPPAPAPPALPASAPAPLRFSFLAPSPTLPRTYPPARAN